MPHKRVDDHFREVTKMIKIGKSGKREVEDYMLTRSISVDIFSAIFVEGGQVVSATTQLKFLAHDGKKRLAKIYERNRLLILL